MAAIMTYKYLHSILSGYTSSLPAGNQIPVAALFELHYDLENGDTSIVKPQNYKAEITS